MAFKPPVMAHRKRPGTSGGDSMAAPGSVSCPSPHPTESCDLKALPRRQRSVRYPKQSHDLKAFSRSFKAQYSPKSQKVSCNHSEVIIDAETEVKWHSSKADTEPEGQQLATPSTPEHEHYQDDHEGADYQGGADSLDDDSSSDYINNTSDDEEDYDDGEYIDRTLFIHVK